MRWLSRARHSGDEGFGLIEMVVALLIAGLVFSALATTLISSLRTSLLSRQNQQAADFATQAIEEMRLQPFGSLSVDPSLYTGGPLGLASCAGNAGVVGLPGAAGCQPLVQPSGATPAGVTAVSTLVGNNGTGNANTNNTVFTLYRYVTQVPGQPTSGVRRVTVYVQWTLSGSTHTRSSSTDISYSQRGLPLPYFALKPGLSSQTINPGAVAVHMFTLENKGAPDHWNLTLAGFTSGMTLWADTDGLGIFNTATDKKLKDTTADGIVDTGRVDPGTTVRFFLVLDTTANPTASGTHTTTLTAKSVAQPGYPTSAQTATATTIVQGGVVIPPPSPTPTVSPSGPPAPVAEAICSLPSVTWPAAVNGYTTRAFLLHNNGLSNSPLQPQLNLSTGGAAFVDLGEYSSDVAPGAAGRLVTSSGATSGNALRAVAGSGAAYVDWDADLSKQSVAGGALLHLWVAAGASGQPVPAGASVQATVYVTKNNGDLQQDLGFVSAPITSGCVGFQEIAVPLSLITPSPYSISNNNQIHVRVGVTSPTPLRFGYDTSSMPAALGLAVR